MRRTLGSHPSSAQGELSGHCSSRGDGRARVLGTLLQLLGTLLQLGLSCARATDAAGPEQGLTRSWDQSFPEQSGLGIRCQKCRVHEQKRHHLPERIKKMPETKARIVLWGRTCPMLLRMKPMNMKKRLTRGNGVAERIISDRGDGRMPSASGSLTQCSPSRVKCSWRCTPAGPQAPALPEQPGLHPLLGGAFVPWPLAFRAYADSELCCRFT